MDSKTRLSNLGTVVSVRGSVVDIRFDQHLPPIYSVLRAGDEGRIVIEVLAQLDEHRVRGITRRTREEVFAIARKALTDLAGTDLEERLGEVFTRRLRDLGGEAKAILAAALKTSANPALVRSAFDLPAEQRAAIQQALNGTFSAEIHVRFETAPNVISGIELTSNGQKWARSQRSPPASPRSPVFPASALRSW